jgi:sulfur carrier protein
MTRLVVNGVDRELAGHNLAELAAELGLPVRGVALACNGEVVPRSSWSSWVLKDGDVIELVTAVQGGAL